MKERPILFSGPMVRAILDGRKTQTRRVLKRQYLDPTWIIRPATADRFNGHTHDWWLPGGTVPVAAIRCPYGVPGDRLWVREAFGIPDAPYEREDKSLLIYRADESPRMAELNKHFWRPSIFMPRWASRLTLEVLRVRVERLQEISEDDAKAEGAVGAAVETFAPSHRAAFENLWGEINGAESWKANPWVWVVEFQRTGKER